MTLVELVISVSLLGLVAAALSGAIVFFLRTQGSAGERIDQTRGLQQLVNYLPADVASAQLIQLDPPWVQPCLTLGTPVLNLVWSESYPGSDVVTVSVTYVISSDGSRVVRSICDDGGQATLTVARNVTNVAVDGAPADATVREVVMSLEYDGAEYLITGSSRNR